MNILESLVPDLKALHRKRFLLIIALFNLMPILYAIRPLLKNSADLNDWYLSVFLMFVGGFGPSLNFGGNYWGIEGGFVFHRLVSPFSIKKVIYSKIMLSLLVFLIIIFSYCMLIFFNLSIITFNIMLLFIGYFIFILSFSPFCFLYLSIKYPAPTYSNWLYPNRTSSSLVLGFQTFLLVLFPLFFPLILFSVLELYAALVIIFALSCINFASITKLIDKAAEIFYKERVEILNKLS